MGVVGREIGVGYEVRKRGVLRGNCGRKREYFHVMEDVASESSVPEWTLFYTGCKENSQSGIKKILFLHRNHQLAKFGAQMRHFPHRKPGVQAVWCQKDTFSTPEVASERCGALGRAQRTQEVE